MKCSTRFDPGKVALEKLAQIVTYALLLSIFFLAMEDFTAFHSNIPEHKRQFLYMYVGSHGKNALVPFMWTSLVFSAMAVALLLNPSTRKNELSLGLAAGAVFIASWLEKGLGMIAVGFMPNPFGQYSEYKPTGPEIAITLGVWAFGLLILTVLYKIATGI